MLAALHELDFDFATGKLADADYQALRVGYERRALSLLKATDPDAVSVAPPHRNGIVAPPVLAPHRNGVAGVHKPGGARPRGRRMAFGAAALGIVFVAGVGAVYLRGNHSQGEQRPVADPPRCWPRALTLARAATTRLPRRGSRPPDQRRCGRFLATRALARQRAAGRRREPGATGPCLRGRARHGGGERRWRPRLGHAARDAPRSRSPSVAPTSERSPWVRERRSALARRGGGRPVSQRRRRGDLAPRRRRRARERHRARRDRRAGAHPTRRSCISRAPPTVYWPGRGPHLGSATGALNGALPTRRVSASSSTRPAATARSRQTDAP